MTREKTSVRTQEFTDACGTCHSGLVVRRGIAAGVSIVGLLVSGDAKAEPPAQWGGFGYATVGAHGGNWTELQSSLSRERALGPFFEINPLTLHLGGGGKALLFDRLLVGGKGFGWFIGGDEREGITASLSGGGGGLDVGFAAYNLDHILIYPFAGASAFGVTVDVESAREEETFRFGDDGVIGPGQSGSFSSGFLAMEFGVGIQRMVMTGSRTEAGGLLIGFEAGFLAPVFEGQWSDADGFEVSGVPSFSVSGGYLRLTLGGGGFFFDPDPKYEARDQNFEDDDLDAYQGDSFRDE